MIRLGLIRNPRSLRNRGKAEAFRREAAAWLGSRFAEPASKTELRETLRTFAAEGIDTLAIDGGDGTVRDVLSPLPEIYGDRLPRIALLPSGNTNLIAADVGSVGRGLPALAELRRLERLDQLPILRRPPLLATWNDASHAPLLGFFLGAAAYTRGVSLAHKAKTYKKIAHGAGVVVAVFSALVSALGGPSRRSWLAGKPLDLVLDGQPAPSGARFLFLATTLERLVLGIWPFWNAELGPIRYLDVSGQPERLVGAVLKGLRGKAPPWLRQSPHYRSGSAGRIDMLLDHPFVLDGEAFPAGSAGVRLTAGPPLDFIAPRRR